MGKRTGGTQEGRVRKASWEVTLKWLRKEKIVCQADRWAGWAPPHSRNGMCKSLKPACIGGILGPIALSAWWGGEKRGCLAYKRLCCPRGCLLGEGRKQGFGI